MAWPPGCAADAYPAEGTAPPPPAGRLRRARAPGRRRPAGRAAAYVPVGQRRRRDRGSRAAGTATGAPSSTARPRASRVPGSGTPSQPPIQSRRGWRLGSEGERLVPPRARTAQHPGPLDAREEGGDPGVARRVDQRDGTAAPAPSATSTASARASTHSCAAVSGASTASTTCRSIGASMRTSSCAERASARTLPAMQVPSLSVGVGSCGAASAAALHSDSPTADAGCMKRAPASVVVVAQPGREGRARADFLAKSLRPSLRSARRDGAGGRRVTRGRRAGALGLARRAGPRGSRGRAQRGRPAGVR